MKKNATIECLPYVQPLSRPFSVIADSTVHDVWYSYRPLAGTAVVHCTFPSYDIIWIILQLS